MIIEKALGELKAFRPILIVSNLGLILTKFIKFLVIYRIVRGFVILIGLITLLKWIGYDFSHVMHFFGSLPELTNLQNTWVGEVYNAIFKKVLEFINGIAENAPPPPDGHKVMDAVRKTVEQGKNM